MPRNATLDRHRAVKARAAQTGDTARAAHADRELRTAKLAEHIRQVIESAPPLTAEQVERLRALLPSLQEG